MKEGPIFFRIIRQGRLRQMHSYSSYIFGSGCSPTVRSSGRAGSHQEKRRYICTSRHAARAGQRRPRPPRAEYNAHAPRPPTAGTRARTQRQRGQQQKRQDLDQQAKRTQGKTPRGAVQVVLAARARNRIVGVFLDTVQLRGLPLPYHSTRTPRKLSRARIRPTRAGDKNALDNPDGHEAPSSSPAVPVGPAPGAASAAPHAHGRRAPHARAAHRYAPAPHTGRSMRINQHWHRAPGTARRAPHQPAPKYRSTNGGRNKGLQL